MLIIYIYICRNIDCLKTETHMKNRGGEVWYR